MNAQYFIYDPDYSFLCLGVLGAIHEIEFMKMYKRTFNQNFLWYQLGELVVDCPKVNYKLNYKPGTVIDPRTKQLIRWDDIKSKVEHYKRMPIEFKKLNLTCCDLIDLPFNFQTDYELMVQSLDAAQYWKEWPFLYDNTRVLQIQHLTENF